MMIMVVISDNDVMMITNIQKTIPEMWLLSSNFPEEQLDACSQMRNTFEYLLIS